MEWLKVVRLAGSPKCCYTVIAAMQFMRDRLVKHTKSIITRCDGGREQWLKTKNISFSLSQSFNYVGAAASPPPLIGFLQLFEGNADIPAQHKDLQCSQDCRASVRCGLWSCCSSAVEQQ